MSASLSSFAFVMPPTKCILLVLLPLVSCVRYEPNWKSLDSRPLPVWYDEAKVGIFIHWGVFSVPSFGSEWFWYYWKGPNPSSKFVQFVSETERPDWTYADYAGDFTAEFYNPEQWAEIFKASGAKYVVQVTKHHEGFTSWPSAHSFNWNAKDVGPNRDLVGELATAIRSKTDLHFGVYHSLFEWFNPIYLQDKAANFTTQNFVSTKTMPELYELVNRYKPDIVWSDGDGHALDTYWNSTNFLAWLYNESPVKDTVVVNDRWGTNCNCKHGGFLTCTDRYNPKTLQKRKFENAMTIQGGSWGFNREATLSRFIKIESLIETLIQTVSCGGNILVNVGPTKEGVITPIYEERLRQMGSWLQVNGEAIYKTVPWAHQNDTVNPSVWYTSSKSTPSTVFAIALKWPSKTLTLGAPTPTDTTTISLVGSTFTFKWKAAGQSGVTVDIPEISFADMPCKWAWVFKLTNVQ